MIFSYKKFKNTIFENKNKIIDKNNEKSFNDFIDNAYIHFKKTQEPINTLDIINYVEISIGKELDDNDYEELYYKITGEDLNADEIFDLEDEKKFIIK